MATTDETIRGLERAAAQGDDAAAAALARAKERTTVREARLEIGWRDPSVPMDTPVHPREVMRTEVMSRAQQHLAIEGGADRAQRCAARLVDILTRLANVAAERGETIVIHTTNQTTAPQPWDRFHGLGVEVRAVSKNQVVWDIQVFSGPCTLSGRWPIDWRLPTDGNLRRTASNVPALVRQAARVAKAT